MKHRQGIRHLIQLVATAFTNGYAAGFFKGAIFTGKSKGVCVPVLNCYSCPGALGACPIGSLQAVLGSRKFSFSFLVPGLLMLFGLLLGRVVCGFLCPFGFLQELLHKIPFFKITMPKKLDRCLRWVKYIVLAVLVVALPIFLNNKFGTAPPYFCQWLCPAGTLEGGIPLLLKDEGLRSAVGFLFYWKLSILIVILLWSVAVYRPFCKYFCPLGAFYALFNGVSLYRLEMDSSKCTGCKICEKACGMGVEVTKNINASECIRCGKCIDACPAGAISRAKLCACKKTSSDV